MNVLRTVTPCIFFCCLFAFFHGRAAGQDGAAPQGWSATAELTGVWTAGNSTASTFGLNASVRREWARSELKVDGGGIRTEAVRMTRVARGSVESYEIEEETDRERTAESYYARARFDRRLSEAFYTFAGADWLRNTFSGVDSRTLFAAGAGNRWIADERTRFKTDAALTYTLQDDVVNNPFVNSEFAGVRAALDLWKYVSSSAEFASVLVADWNLDNREDVRLDWTSSLPVSINARLALKPSLQLLWRNEPSLIEVPLVAPDGSATGELVTTPLEKLDTFFTLALVVKI